MAGSTDVEKPEGEVEEAPPVPYPAVEALLGTMSKALRAFNMYEANNPVFQRFQAALRHAFEELWDRTDALDLGVTEHGFSYHGHLFSVDRDRESLSFIFYKDGVRNLSFLPGFEDEVGDFMDAVNRAIRKEADADDLISALWEEDFSSLQYGYVDLLTEGLSLPEQPRQEASPLNGDAMTELTLVEDETQTVSHAGAAAAARTALPGESFDETLYFLDQAEIAALETEVRVEMERDLRTDVLNALFDRLEEPNPDRQEEILGILDQLLPLFLSRGEMANAARVLDELDRLQDRDSLSPKVRERIEALFERLSDPAVLEQFVQAVEDGAVAPDSKEVSLFFSRLHAQALPILIRFSEMSESQTVRSRLSAAIDGLAERYPETVNELLVSDEAPVVAGAARVSGRVGLAEAVPGLEAALRNPHRSVRLAVVKALVSIRRTPALQALASALEDEDREVRIEAANALGAVRFGSARDAFERVLEGRRIREADLTEKMAMFEAYGAVGGRGAVEWLSEVLHARRLFGRRNPTELRACAALGLGKAALPDARAELEKARKDDDPVVRNAVTRALSQTAEES